MKPMPTAAALGELEQILANAYGTIDGQEELNAVIAPALDIVVWRDLGTKYTPMKFLVHALREQLVARGPEDLRTCVIAFYVELPGSEALRRWVRENLPDSYVLVSDETFVSERAGYVEHRSEGQRQLAASAFETLRQAAGQPFIGQEIDRFRLKLGEARHLMRRLNGYLGLTDALASIQVGAFARLSFLMLKPGFDRDDEREISMISGTVTQAVQGARVGMEPFLYGEEAVEEGMWLTDLESAVAPLADWDGYDPYTLRSASLEMRGVLRVQRPRLNRLLIVAAADLPFDDLAALLRRASERAPEESPLRGRLADAAQALDDIAERLDKLTAARDRLQDADTAIWALESVVRTSHDVEARLEIASIWRTLRDRLVALDPLEPSSNERLQTAIHEFDDALNSADLDGVRLAARLRVISHVVQLQLFRTDADLRNQCSAVAKLEPALAELAEGSAPTVSEDAL